MKKIIIILFCISIFSLSFAQNENADAEFLKVKKEYTVNEDGSIDYHYSKELKLLSHYAFHRLYGETFIVYNTEFQTLKINSAYTIMADGKKVVTPENAFNEVLPRFANNAPAYNHIRELVVTHTGLEVGAVIHLDYTIHSEKGFFPALMFDEVLQETSPAKELTIKVNIPNDKNLNYDLLNLDAEPTTINENGNKVYTWVFSNLKASSKDYYQVNQHLDAPRLMFSTAENMSTIYNNFVNQKAFNLSTNDQMNKLVDKVLSENIDELSVALALQKVVSNDINNLNIPLKYTGFICRPSIETWNSNQGTMLEKSILLTALLQKANINANAIAIVPNQLYQEQIGDLFIFSDFAVHLKLEEYGDLIISAHKTDKQNRLFSLAGQTVLSIDKDLESPKVIETENMTNTIFMKGEFNIGDCSKLSGKLNLVLKANSNPYLALTKDASTINKMVSGGIGSKDIISVNTVQLSQEMSNTQFAVEKKEPFKKLNTYLSFEIPFVNNGVDSWHMNLLTAQRTSELEIPETIHEKYEFTVTLPEGLKLVTQPKNIEINNQAGHLLIKFIKTDDGLKLTREIKLTNKIIELKTYDDFRAIMNAWNNPNYKKVIVKD